MNLKNKRVLLRVDFNVPMRHGAIADDFRIRASIPTIKKTVSQGAQVFLIAHLEENGTIPHLESVYKKLKFFLKTDVAFWRGKIGEFPKHTDSKIVLLDNIRLNQGEKKNDRAFAQTVASLGDIFVNEAFSDSHRKHASIVGIPKFLPSYLGDFFKKEVKTLSKSFDPPHPFLLVMAGNKFATKEPLLNKFLKIADHVFIGGALANTFLFKRGFDIGKSKVEKIIIPKSILWHKKIILPIDYVKKNGVIYDAGPKTIKMLGRIAERSKFVLWNGTLGLCEKGFISGTKNFARHLEKSKAYKIVGGGDTAAAIRGFKLEKNFNFISTGGGAMLEFLATGTLPGIEAVKKSSTGVIL